MISRLLFGAFVAAVALSGCSGLEKRDKMNLLDTASRQYASAIRWERFDVARSLLKPRTSTAPSDLTPAQATESASSTDTDIDVTADETRILNIAPDGNQAVVFFAFEYVPTASNTTKTISQKVLMYYEEETRNWFIDAAELPDF